MVRDVMMTGARGEGFIEVDGEQVPILLTNRALAEVEKRLGVRFLGMLAGGDDSAHMMAYLFRELSVECITELLRAGLEYGRQDAGLRRQRYTLDEAWQIIDQHGIAEITVIVATALGEVLSYHRTGDKENETDSPP